ncbi:hypothetical protein RhiirA5_359718 [Rhizophagus irregularis]|uniref:Uncharacterized protein n=1 Tax=Rhizophagus irregularis TaxID=588596 RepID=A0A2I1E5H4_9GLOM|nr:hypothetical protein RhiirA5_359718 [Rhizophagus irregularis]PKY17349.1 hypothetical protein RhiirB3_404201 [Rhizophagus irregularis]
MDLKIGGNSFNKHFSYCERSSYEKPIRKTGNYFAIEEYEVFQIIKDTNEHVYR